MIGDVYLDYNGSSPLDPRVGEAMVPVLTGEVGNASSVHRFGLAQSSRVDEAREQVASMVGGRAPGVVFTAGATESNNLALRGLLESAPPGRQRIVISAVEHGSVRATARWIEAQGLAKVDVVPVTPGGFVDPAQLAELMDDDVVLVSVMAANSETGVLNPIGELTDVAKSAGAWMHTDGTQYVGRAELDMDELGVDLVSLSGHKICGPGGVGALVGSPTAIREMRPLIIGGGHERGLRSGSLNVAGIVGLGAAAELASRERAEESARVGRLRDRLLHGLHERLEGVIEIGDASRRLANTAAVRFAGADGEAVLVNMDPVAVSTGSACSSGAIEPSAVLTAMGIDRDDAFEVIRFSLGRFTNSEEVAAAIDSTVTAVEYVRAMNTTGADS